jgi:hypothetical protein
MSDYRPDAFGSTAPERLWSVFNGVAILWQLSGPEQKALLGGAEPQPPRSAPPDAATTTRIELLKDCYLHTRVLFASTPDRQEGIRRANEWPRRMLRSFALCPRPSRMFQAILDSKPMTRTRTGRQLRESFIDHVCHSLTPLEIMGAARHDLLRMPIPLDFPHINNYWRQPETAPETLGLEAMRSFVGRVSGAFDPTDPDAGRRLTTQLILVGERLMNPV